MQTVHYFMIGATIFNVLLAIVAGVSSYYKSKSALRDEFKAADEKVAKGAAGDLKIACEALAQAMKDASSRNDRDLSLLWDKFSEHSLRLHKLHVDAVRSFVTNDELMKFEARFQATLAEIKLEMRGIRDSNDRQRSSIDNLLVSISGTLSKVAEKAAG
jgi:hypothetical protein